MRWLVFFKARGWEIRNCLRSRHCSFLVTRSAYRDSGEKTSVQDIRLCSDRCLRETSVVSELSLCVSFQKPLRPSSRGKLGCFAFVFPAIMIFWSLEKNRRRSLSAATINGKLLAGARLGIGLLNMPKGMTLVCWRAWLLCCQFAVIRDRRWGQGPAWASILFQFLL